MAASAPSRSTAPTRADVASAATWLQGQIVHTHVLRSGSLDRIAGTRLWLKAESLQTTGSYKYRGALLAIGRIAAAGTSDGVIAQSTGNHALAVAEAARRHGLAATLVLPTDAAPAKITKARASGARVILAGTTVKERLSAVAELHAATGHVVVDAYDNRDVVLGQGTATMELIAEVNRQGIELGALVLPVGGGGGVAGACLAAQGRELAVYGVEPEGCNSLSRSLAAGRRVAVEPGVTLADGLRPSLVGELPFEIVRDVIAGVLLVDDDAIGRAVRLAMFEAALLIEPSAAAALAGALTLAATGAFTDIGVILTGGNVEPSVLARLLADFTGSTGSTGKGADA